MFLGQRLGTASRTKLGMAISNSCTKERSPEIEFAMETIMAAVYRDGRWGVHLPIIKSLYSRGASWRGTIQEEVALPTDVATDICVAPADFPLPLVALADNRLRSSAGATASKLLDVANTEAWFSQDNL
jgi:hypothetical protein